MRQYIYKTLIATIAIIVVFEFTIGKEISRINEKIEFWICRGAKKIVQSIKKEIKKLMKKKIILVTKKENY